MPIVFMHCTYTCLSIITLNFTNCLYSTKREQNILIKVNTRNFNIQPLNVAVVRIIILTPAVVVDATLALGVVPAT